MASVQEFHYRVAASAHGHFPGHHRSRSGESGFEFRGHADLRDAADPGRLDLHASLRDPFGNWIVRVYSQRKSVPVVMVADLSASMAFRGRSRKLDVVADFAESLAWSAWRTGDSFGFVGCDAEVRADLHLPQGRARGAGSALAQQRSDEAQGPIARVRSKSSHLLHVLVVAPQFLGHRGHAHRLGGDGVGGAKDDKQVAQRTVQLGGSRGNQWVVLGGLKAGEQVVVDGFQKIRPKAPVTPVPWTPLGASAPAGANAPAASAPASAASRAVISEPERSAASTTSAVRGARRTVALALTRS